MTDNKGARPPIQKEAVIEDIGDGIYCIMAPPVGFLVYLIPGSERALLIDTGMGIGSLRKAVESVTNLPVTLVNTHGHPDHCGGNAEFEPALLNPADLDVYHEMATREFRAEDVANMPGDVNWADYLQPTGPEPVAAYDGQILDIGGREFELIFAPGHTHGSLCVYEEATGTLFTGDNVMAMTTAMREWNSSSVRVFHDSLVRLSGRPIRRLLGGHRPNDNPPELLTKVIRCAQEILDGSAERDEERSFRGVRVLYHECDGVSIEYRADNVM